MGSVIAITVTEILFFLWRVASVYDAGGGSAHWIGLAFEGLMHIFLSPFYLVAMFAAGSVLVRMRARARWQAVTISAAVGVLYGLLLYIVGAIGGENGQFDASLRESLAVLAVAGAFGGYAGHAGWHPADPNNAS